MSSVLDDLVFGEPSGRPNSLVHFVGALVFLSVYTYGLTVGEAGASSWLLVMTVASGVAGVAGSLPAGSRQVAGCLRLVTIDILVSLVAAGIVAPEVVLA